MKPKETNALDMAFGPKNINNYLPSMESLPKEFRRGSNNKWNKIVTTWFFEGLPKETKFIPKPDIDTNMALQHISCILRSFAPQHEHKEAGCAYLLSLWFEDVMIPNKKEIV